MSGLPTQSSKPAPPTGGIMLKGQPSKPIESATFHMKGGLEVGRRGPDVAIVFGGEETRVERGVWVSAMAQTMGPGASPEVRTILDFLMDAKQETVERIADIVIGIRDTHGTVSERTKPTASAGG